MMLVQAAEELFKEIRAAHPEWSTQFCSGFVHGADHEGTRRTPVYTFVRQPTDQYALGYLTGFATYRGSDVELEGWFPRVAACVEEARAKLEI